MREDTETSATTDSLRVTKDAQESLEQSFTPSLARRLSRQFIEQTRQSLPRSPSIPREKLYRSTTDESTDDGNESENRQYNSSTVSDQSEYRSRSCDRGVRRTNSLLENSDRSDRSDRFEHRSPRRSVSLFDDEDESLPPLPRQVMTLGRKYRDTVKPGSSSGLRRDSFHNYRTEKIQEEPPDESSSPKTTNGKRDSASTSDCNSVNDSSTNPGDTASSLSARSCETSPTESSSNLGDCTVSSYKPDTSRDFENRLLAAENLIKESKLRNLGPGKFDPNLTSSYKDTDKCDKELPRSMTDATSSASKRRSCIPSLRLRSGSLTREAAVSGDGRKTSSGPREAGGSPHGPTPERSILSKFFRAGSSGRDQESKEKSPKEKGPRRISRFLRPDFFDTPREESRYVKEKEAQKAAENERRKSRFTKKKSESKTAVLEEGTIGSEEKPEKELKNEANAITRDKTESLPRDNKSENDETGSSSARSGEVAKFDRQSSKNSFLQSLEKKLEKFRSNDESSKLANGTSGPVDREGRENSAPPEDRPENESGRTKRATSVEDLSIGDGASSSTAAKRGVSSVLGLFKNESSRASFGGQRPQSTILSKFKRNPYKGSRSDGVLISEQNPSTSGSGGSKIPTKFAKSEAKPSRKVSENKKSPEKIVAERKKSPSKERSKEKSPPDRSPSKKSGSVEKQTKPVKKVGSEKSAEGKTDKPEKSSSSKEEAARQSTPPEKSVENKSGVVSRLATTKKSSPEKMTDNKQTEAKSSETEESKIARVKKNVKSLTSLVKNGSVAKLEKSEEGEKKAKKVAKANEVTDKESADGTKKKKKVVRVAKKVVKKSDSSDGKSDEKDKTTKTPTKKITSSARKDSSPESIVKSKEKSPESTSGSKERSLESIVKSKEKSPESTSRSKENSPESIVKSKEKSPESTSRSKEKSPESIVKSKEKSPESTSRSKEKSPEAKICTSVSKTKELNSPSSCVPSTEDSSDSTPLTMVKKLERNCYELPKPEALVRSSEATASKEPESKPNGAIPNSIQKSDSDCKSLLAGLGTAKTNRSNLKLDLSKIPQHSLKGAATLKKDCTKVEGSNSKPDATTAKIAPSESPKTGEDGGGVSQSLSKRTHQADATGSKVVIDQPSRARDLADLQRESSSAEVYRNSEKITAPSSHPEEKSKDLEEAANLKSEWKKEIDVSSIRSTNLPLEEAARRPSPPRIVKETANDRTEDTSSPVEDNESLDSWSICSADLNHRHDLHSPTSPTYSPSSRGDHPESIIDRIRRKSFYSRFNERKRKSSLNAPPPGVALPASSTLPRKYSFNSSRDKDCRKPNLYASTTRRHPERSYSLYNEETPSYRKSPVDRYSDVGSIGSFSGDLKSPSDPYDGLGSCYDPLRRYRVSPDSLSSHRKYQSTDYGLDNDGSYKSRMSPSFANDGSLDSYPGRSMLPRKYGSASSFPEAKSADYYEELLAPTRSDYLSSRKTPVANEYLGRRENGYHNGNLDLPQLDVDKWKTYSEKISGLDITDGGDGRLEKKTRSTAGKDNESQDLPASSSEPDTSTSKAE